MPTVSGIRRKPAYGGAEISLFSVNNSVSQSGTFGSAEGMVSYHWSLSWDDSGFTGNPGDWYAGPENGIIHIDNGASDLEGLPNSLYGVIAEYRIEAGKTNCTTYVQV